MPPADANPAVAAICSVVHQVLTENVRYLASHAGRPLRFRAAGQAALCEIYDARAVRTGAARPHSLPCPSFDAVFRFVHTITHRTRLSNEVAAACLVYIDRLVERTALVLSATNYERVVFASLVLAQKMFDDFGYSNVEYARLRPGDANLEEVNAIERHTLQLLGYELFVPEAAYNAYQGHLQRMHDGALKLDASPPPEPAEPALTTAKDGIVPAAFDPKILWPKRAVALRSPPDQGAGVGSIARVCSKMAIVAPHRV
jgi:hypothetical protein